MQADETVGPAPDRPAQLFRYFSEKAVRTFAPPELWFARIRDFNDPFELLIDARVLTDQNLPEIAKRKFAFSDPHDGKTWFQFVRENEPKNAALKSYSINDYPQDIQQKLNDRYGVVCFTENKDSLLMWGHYTNCHRGFVVEFDPQHELFKTPDFAEVHYSDTRAKPGETKDSKVLFQKSSEWAYEREYRLVKRLDYIKSGRALDVFKKEPKEYHYLPLPMDSVKAVYLGCQMSDDDKAKLQAALAAYTHVKINAMKRDSIHYRLNAIAI